jgi:hypothetical protein
MEKRERLTRLLASVLAEQTEATGQNIGDTPIPAERLALLARGLEQSTEREAVLMLRSPAARRALYFEAQTAAAEAFSALRAAQIRTAIAYRAAAPAVVEPIALDANPDFVVTLYPLDPEGTQWTVHLKASPNAARILRSRLRLIDNEGDVWLSGELDSDHELSSPWTLGIPPQRAATSRALRVEPL